MGIFAHQNHHASDPGSIELHALAATCHCGGVSQVQIAVTREHGRVRVQELAERCASCGRFG